MKSGQSFARLALSLALIVTVTSDWKRANSAGRAIERSFSSAPSGSPCAASAQSTTCGAPRFGSAIYGVYQSFTKIIPVDFNGDGRLDLAGITYSPGQVILLSGDGKGAFKPTITLPAEDRANDLAVLDFNNDGRVDIAVISDFTPAIQVFINNGQSGFNLPMRVLLPEPNSPIAQPRNLEVADFTGDKRDDLLLTYDDDIVLIRNGGQGGYKANIKRPGELAPSMLGIGDLTGDGVADLLSAPGTGPGISLRVYPADGQGGFGSPKSFSFIGQITSRAVITDFNGDGKPDALIGTTAYAPLPGGGATGSAISILPGDGAGSLGAQNTISINGLAANQVTNLTAADFNGDAKPDLVFGASGRLNVMLNNGSGGLEAPFAFDAGFGAGMIVSGDFNQDSKADLITGGSNSVTTWLNRCGAAGFFISGRVTDSNIFQGVSGVTVTLSGAQSATTQTDIGGNYQFPGLTPGGAYTVSVQRSGYEFDPTSRSVTNLAVDQPVNFNAVRLAVNVSAASYAGAPLAPDSIVAAFGEGLARAPMAATTLPLPLYFNDTKVDVRDSAGATRPAPLFFISPAQVNYLIPPETATGPATVKISLNSNTSEHSVSAQTVEIAAVAPGLFSANSDGRGVAAAVVLRIKTDGSQSYEPVAVFDQTQNKFVARPIDLGPDLGAASDQVFLILFGTGLRNRSSLSNVTMTIGGAAAEVLYADAVNGLVGLDQVNARLTRSLAGRGEIDVAMVVNSKPANIIRISIK